VHVYEKIDEGLGYVEYDARRCTRCEHDSTAGVCTEYTDNVYVRAPSALPFVGKEFCYRVSATNEADLNKVVRMNGCLEVKVDSTTMKQYNILKDVMATCKVKAAKPLDSVRKRIAQDSLTDDEFLAVVAGAFSNTEHGRMKLDLEHSLGVASGRFTRETRYMGAMLYCIGFDQFDSVLREFGRPVNSQESWFLSLGDADDAWFNLDEAPEIDRKYESFADFWQAFNGRTVKFIEYITKCIRLDPQRFFSINTRPMALRGLGSLNKQLFMTYCANLVNPQYLIAKNLVSVDPESIDGEVFVPPEPDDNVDATWKVTDRSTVQRCALSVMLSLTRVHQQRKLRCVLTSVLVAELAEGGREMIEMDAVGSNAVGAICEVHILCASRQIFLVFAPDDNGAPGSRLSGSKAAHAFKFRQGGRCRAHVYFRDVQLLTCNVFSHLMWRLKRRVQFAGVTVSHRFSDDKEYSSLIWAFMRQLEESTSDATCAIEATTVTNETDMTGKPSVSAIDLSALNDRVGICVVPMAKDAHCQTRPPCVGDNIFTITPPTFGCITEIVGNVFTIKSVGGRNTRTVTRLIHKNKINVLKCKISDNGAYMVPASALISMRSGTPSVRSVTLFLPDALSLEWKRELIAQSRDVAINVEMIRVETYDFDKSTDSRIDQLVRVVQQNLVIN
jgi:hypothetical protein